ncbi:glycoside hydrolase family 9 protein [Herbinix luporum]|jgi:endoglucanase|uniref:Glucanase n=1 Tax=Herbinix luporum TaxID=1679721 RepID=A0A0K8J6T5_9FIRM|nr:glycoside hydrolase family 9 protein [Herbinix luporum]CUH93326.1 Cellulose 1,4-beta-cellobiosidase [Herbinix luporum]
MKKRFIKKMSKFMALIMLAMCFSAYLPPVKSNAETKSTKYVSKGDLIRNNTFDGGVGLPWHVVETYPALADFAIENGKYNITIRNKGTERWDVQFRHRGLTLERGHTYTVKFTVVATKDCKIYPKVGDQGEPYAEYWNYNQNWDFVELKANTPVTITQEFTMREATKPNCEFTFHLGGDCATSPLPYTISFDDIHLLDPDFEGYPAEEEEPTNEIRVNQEGYYPGLEKKATLVSSSTSPVKWELLDSSRRVVDSGQTKVFGFDKASGDHVHIIDFSSYETEGRNYVLVSGSAESMPFNIGTDIYSKMKYDAMKYFYHNRSGIEIKMPYCEEPQWARPAGHPNDLMKPDPTKSYQGNYTLDVTGGWYDAGDHGKYVVNGGISVWTVMNQYERALYYGDTSVAPFADNTLNIPESGNGIPDILDEARYEVEMLMKMQVPSGPLKGMAHHKGHDERWTALAVPPHMDTMDRYLQPPSTAATLNLAAAAAQSARLWEEYDSTFAAKCLSVAETAWEAAVANPNIYATMEQEPGGGPYGDDYVGDEFYWAACELFVTTGNTKYLNYLRDSKHYLEMPYELVGGEALGLVGCFDWGNTAGLGTITLALVPNKLEASEVNKARSNIKTAADKFIAIAEAQGYGVPIEEGPIGDNLVGYPWGSNSFVVNEAIVMSYAFDFSDHKDLKYLNGVANAMDYLMGRNALVQCYISGYGENPAENPHHRFWSYQADNSLPKAPPGCLVGGPNSGLQDPWVRGSGWLPGSRPAQKCYMDNIESWSTNEITINWNAPLAWVTAYLDEQGPKATGGGPVVPVYGDVNGDGSIDALDFAALKRYLLTQDITAINYENSDMNSDGVVDAIDFALLKKLLLN